MSCFLACPRKHYYSYELGLKTAQDSTALRIGTAMHAALEARANGYKFEDAYREAISCGDLDEFMAATIFGLMAGYWAKWGDSETMIEGMDPEIEFRHPIIGSLRFDAAGKIDGLGTMDGETVIVEHKTTGESIEPTSSYWERLAYNPQLLAYRRGAESLGLHVTKVVYDVIRKPSIAPKASVPCLDRDGLKIVLDKDGNRVMKKDGTPKQTADAAKGEVLQANPETADQFGERLAKDATERPDFYFVRKEVYLDDDQIAEFDIQRRGVCKALLHYKAESRRAKRPEDAWPRNCSGFSCPACEYKGICLHSIHVDRDNVPDGFRIGRANEELSAACAAN